MPTVDLFEGSIGGPAQIGVPTTLNVWFDADDVSRGTVNGNQDSTWDAGETVGIDHVRIRWAYGGMFSGGAAGAFQIWGSATGTSGPWTSVLADGNPVGTAGASYPGDFEHTYALGGTSSYRYWRFKSTTINNNDIFLIEGLGTAVSPPVGILPEYVPPGPADALLEIWTDEVGGAEWGSATWGEDVWGDAGWVSITHLGVEVTIRWGAVDADKGILADQVAADWSVTLYDPDRELDPANPDSPYYPDVVPGLPIRLSHRGVVIRTGQVETATYSYQNDTGVIRATDNIANMARAKVPEDVTMADFMKARARDAIDAAGLGIATPSNPNDYTIPAQVAEEHDVWWWVREAARDRHVIAYIDQHNAVRWRAYSVPLRRGRSVTQANLEEATVLVDDADRLSAVRVLDDDGVTVVELATTPTPAFGRRLHDRTIPTTDAEGWAQAVLDDRAQSGLRWRPGRVRPFTADDVEGLATLEINEEITLSIAGVISTLARVMGGRLRVVWEVADRPMWDFWLTLTTSQSIGLYADQDESMQLVADQDNTEYLVEG